MSKALSCLVAALIIVALSWPIQQQTAAAQPPPTSTPTPTLAPFPTPTPYVTPSAVVILPDALTIASAGDVEARRAQLRAHIWPGGYPASRAFDLYLGVDDPALLSQIDATHVAHVHRYRVVQPYGINVDMWLWQSKQPAGVSLLYHGGHDSTPISETTQVLIPRLMKAGVDVLVVGMVLTPSNPDPIYQGYSIQYHTDPAAMPRANGRHPLHFFLEPSIAGINALKAVYPSRPVHMAGLSGGGWTVTLMAALDPRIQRSFNVAGSLPFDAWPDGSVSPLWGVVWRDWEQGSHHQGHTDTYAIAGYRDLYVLGASGVGRSQLQVLNWSDPCCFGASGADLGYASQVRRRVAQIGEGDWRLWIDRPSAGQTQQHTVSPRALNEILNELGLPPV